MRGYPLLRTPFAVIVNVLTPAERVGGDWTACEVSSESDCNIADAEIARADDTTWVATSASCWLEVIGFAPSSRQTR
jgi:hypothetical protein